MSKKRSKPAKAGGASSDGVGYGKPPAHARFKPGQSGNPSGRPKGTKNLKTLARREFEQKIEVREGQHVREITKKEAFVKGTINRALQKGGKDSDTAFRLLAEIEGDAEAASAPSIPLSQDEDEVLAAFETRLRRKIAEELTAAAAATTTADEGGSSS